MKRILDFVASAFLAILLLPVLLVVALLVRMQLGSPVLFIQPRPGLHGKVFKLVKFRTMLDSYGLNGEALGDAERMTPLGRFLRHSSLDELPELWNVLRGEMSLVGPRPLLVEYLPLYNAEQARRHEVRPGITGWAQINGRNALSWEKKFKLDVWYIDNHTFWLDIRILMRTLAKVLAQHGISSAGEETATRFRGQ
ncbi:MAG: sugar transferase [Hyphomicrobiales bacterium]